MKLTSFITESRNSFYLPRLLAQALKFHPFSPMIFILALALFLLLLLELVTHKGIIFNPLKSRRNIYLLFAIVVIFQIARTVIFFADGGWTIFWHENIFARLLALIKLFFN